MTSFRDYENADLRLTILQLLAQATGYELNSSILRMVLDDYGHRVAADALRAQLAWLEDQTLLAVHQVGELRVARLNERGLDVAQGRAQVTGVLRPAPGGL